MAVLALRHSPSGTRGLWLLLDHSAFPEGIEQINFESRPDHELANADGLTQNFVESLAPCNGALTRAIL